MDNAQQEWLRWRDRTLPNLASTISEVTDASESHEELLAVCQLLSAGVASVKQAEWGYFPLK